MALSDDLLGYVPEDKRAEFVEKTKSYSVLNDDVAVEYVKKSQSLTDKIATPIVEARFKNYKERDWPKELEAEREKIRAELTKGKEETPEQKTIRELTEWKAAQLKKEQDDAKKAEVRAKAHELGLDPLEYEALYALPDVEEHLKKFSAKEKALKAKIEELEKKNKYGASAPAGGGVAGTENTFSRAAMNANPDLRKKYSDAIMAGKQVSLID